MTQQTHVRWEAPTSSGAPRPGAREARLSLYFLLWLVAAPVVGFLLAGDRMFDLGASGEWDLWKAVIIGGLLGIPFVIGAAFGLRAVLKRFALGWVGLLANTALALMAIGMPIIEATGHWMRSDGRSSWNIFP
jgi:hypothetical protein